MTHSIKLFYFPAGLRYTTPLFFIIGFYLLYLGYGMITLAIVLVSVFILTAQYITVIDMQRKQFADAFAFYGIRIVKEKKQFTQLHKIVITKESYAQTVNTRSQSRVMRWSDYTATLVYDGGKTLDLVTRDDKGDVVEFAGLYSKSLNVAIEDHSVTTSSSRLSSL